MRKDSWRKSAFLDDGGERKPVGITVGYSSQNPRKEESRKQEGGRSSVVMADGSRETATSG